MKKPPITKKLLLIFFSLSSGFCYAGHFKTCPYDCGYSREILQNSPAQFQQLLDNNIKPQSKACQKNILNDLAVRLSRLDFKKFCLNHPTDSACKKKLEYWSHIKKRVQILMDLAYGVKSSVITQAQSTNIACEVNFLKKDINHHFEIRDLIRQVSQCGELKKSQEKLIFSDTHPIRGALANTSYILKKDNKGNYAITFPIEFVKGDGYDGPADISNYYQKKVSNCLKIANKYMKGPNGKKLKINISKPSGVSACDKKGQKVHRIKIRSETYRSSMLDYSSKATCAAITHEILHLTGLCDEYEEKLKGHYVHSKTGKIISLSNFFNLPKENSRHYKFKTLFPCRVSIIGNNIMANNKEAWYDVTGQWTSQSSLPPDFFTLNISGQKNNHSKNKSLLTPGQFNSIIYGSCPKNKSFNQCSQLAYQETETYECLSLKKKCEQTNGMGLNKKQLMQTLENKLKTANKLVDYNKTKGQKEVPKYLQEEIKKLKKDLVIVKNYPKQ